MISFLSKLILLPLAIVMFIVYYVLFLISPDMKNFSFKMSKANV